MVLRVFSTDERIVQILAYIIMIVIQFYPIYVVCFEGIIEHYSMQISEISILISFLTFGFVRFTCTDKDPKCDFTFFLVLGLHFFPRTKKCGKQFYSGPLFSKRHNVNVISSCQVQLV